MFVLTAKTFDSQYIAIVSKCLVTMSQKISSGLHVPMC